jgi:translocation and assembly module TamB
VGAVYTERAAHRSTIDDLRLRLRLRTAQPRRAGGPDGQIVHLDAFGMTGDRTSLDVTGRIDLERDVVTLRANGDANLAVIQGVLPQVRGSGRAEISATIGGTTATPTISGNALLTDGRLRTFTFPHALEAINGIVAFDATSVRLDGLRARLADGTVQFGGRMGLTGLTLADYDLTITGHDLRLRYPEGLRSLVEAALTVQGPADAPVLGGSVLVRNAVWTPAFDGTTNVFGSSTAVPLVAEAGPAVAGAASAPAATPALRFDVRLVAPSTFRIENDVARIVASADVTLRGTPEKPQVFGRADIERGEVRFEGRRYVVSRGSLDFTNPDRIQPFFDVEADTRVRVPGQTYRVTLRIAGTTERLQPEFTSDPPLPSADVLSLLLSDRTPTGDVEVTSINAPNQREVDLLQSRATRALTGALSAEVGKVVQETFGVDTSRSRRLVDPYQQVSGLTVNPAARVTIGKRLSDRIYLTYVRSLSSSERDQIILLEYDQSDTMGWVLSQNEDGTYALEVRKRVAF